MCPSCITKPVEKSKQWNELKDYLSSLNIKAITLYETRSSIQPEFKPDYSLNKDNFANIYKSSNVIIAHNTREP